MAKRLTSGAAPARAGRVTGSRSPLAGCLGLAIGAVLFSAAMTPLGASSHPPVRPVSASPQPVVPAAVVSRLPSAPQPPPIPKPPEPPPPPSIPPMPGLSPSVPASSVYPPSSDPAAATPPRAPRPKPAHKPRNAAPRHGPAKVDPSIAPPATVGPSAPSVGSLPADPTTGAPGTVDPKTADPNTGVTPAPPAGLAGAGPAPEAAAGSPAPAPADAVPGGVPASAPVLPAAAELPGAATLAGAQAQPGAPAQAGGAAAPGAAAQPAAPAVPGAPAQPAAVAQPAALAVPGAPAQPAAVAQPAAPAVPGALAQPAALPAAVAQPAEPGVPTAPAVPGAPGQPTPSPGAAAQPARPAQPGTPAAPALPGAATQPAAPAVPGLPAAAPAALAPGNPALVAPACATSWALGASDGGLSIPNVPTAGNLCGAGAVRPTPLTAACTKTVDGAGLQAAVDAARPGDRICATGNSATRLTVSHSGTPAAPILVLGDGRTTLKGLTIKADNVTVGGLNLTGAAAPGVEMTGNGITLVNNTVTSPRGGDGDGIRFFGSNLRILHNTISDTRNLNGAHADCMQTFASDSPTSQHVLIDSNRCDKIANQCLIAEGPNSSAGDGSGRGRSSDIQFTGNYCDSNASQAVMIDDVQNVSVTNNQITGGNDKAFAFDNKSTGAKVSGNILGLHIRFEVGMDHTSKLGYLGPLIGGLP
jgi:Right handed beta helix region